MAIKVTMSEALMHELYDRNILPKFNAGPPEDGVYGWMKVDTEMAFKAPVTIEENVGIYGGAYKGFPGGLKSQGFATVGAFTYSFSALPEPLTVGRYCSISTGLRFLDSAHPLDTLTTSAAMFRPNNHLFARTVTPATREFAKGFSVQPGSYPQIGHDVWIGANVTLSAGISIGTGAVIASGALVTKDVAPYEIVGGNPAKPIRKRFSDSMIEDLLASKWWEYEPSQLFTEDPRDLSAVLARIERGELAPYVPRTITLGA